MVLLLWAQGLEDGDEHLPMLSWGALFTLPLIAVKVKVKVSTLDIVPLRGTPPQKRSGTDHTVLPANFTIPASYLVSIHQMAHPKLRLRTSNSSSSSGGWQQQ